MATVKKILMYCADPVQYSFLDHAGKVVLEQYDDTPPPCFPSDRAPEGPLDVTLVIDAETGRILNWKKNPNLDTDSKEYREWLGEYTEED